MNALNNLAFHHSVSRESGVEVHDVCLQAPMVKSPPDPVDEVLGNFLEKEHLDIRDLRPVSAWNSEATTIRWNSAVRAGTPAPIRLVVIAIEARWRPGSAALVTGPV